MISTEIPPFRIFGEATSAITCRAATIHRAGAGEKGGRRHRAQHAAGIGGAAGDGISLSLPATARRRSPGIAVSWRSHSPCAQVKIDAELSGAKRRAIADIGYGTRQLMVGFSSGSGASASLQGSTLTDLPISSLGNERLQPGARHPHQLHRRAARRGAGHRHRCRAGHETGR